MRHVTWFVEAVENFHFFDLTVHAFADPEAAVAEVKAEGLIKATARIYVQEYVVFLRAAGGELVFNGPLSALCKSTLTADYLTGAKSIPVPKKRRKPRPPPLESAGRDLRLSPGGP